ncbi:MAG: MGMT family protein [Alphaproteobacteria bacterium]|nr:MAG: MGMT family protein [Alphaproteobacteria bacterium]
MVMRVQETPPREVIWGKGTTPLGDVLVGVTPDGELCRVSYTRGREVVRVVEDWLREWPATTFVQGAIPRGWKSLPLVVVGNDYQKRVWEEIMTVPKGDVETYGGIAERIGEGRTSRAVGRACRMCCLAYVVPCQRIIGASGIGGFGDEDMVFKEQLLRMEGWVGKIRAVKRERFGNW